MSTPVYDRLLEKAREHFRQTADRPLPPGRKDTHDQYYAGMAIDSVVAPLTDHDVLDVISEIFDRVGRNRDYAVDGYANLAEALRGTLELCLYRETIPEESL